MSSVAEQVRFSEIEGFWFRKPRASPEEVHAFTGEMTARLCDCKRELRRFEKWNGLCEDCRRDRGLAKARVHCGCRGMHGEELTEVAGWHFEGRDATERCPRYWDRKEVDIEITRKEHGRSVKKKATVRFRVDGETGQLKRDFYIDGKPVDIKGGRSQWEDYG